MPTVLRCLLLSILAIPLAGCLSGSGATSLAPAPANVSALNGGLVGDSLSGAALRQALETEYQALQFGRVGVPIGWEAEGVRGEVVPTQLYRVGSQDCRGYTHSITSRNGTTREVGTACRDGALWTLV